MYGTQKKKTDIFDMRQIEESALKNEGKFVCNFRRISDYYW